MLQIESPAPPPRFALFQLGFRPFFAGAALYGIVAVGLWMAFWVSGESPWPEHLPPTLWHAREMVFGYALAVVAGFLLTAVVNWTGQPSLRGAPLAAAFGLWLLARILPHFGRGAEPFAAAAELGFAALLLFGVTRPVVRARQWQQSGILAKLALLFAALLAWHAGVLGLLEDGARIGLYGALYLILALVFMMARRVLPFFIERGVDAPFVPRQRRWLDIASLFGVLLWAVLEVFVPQAGTAIAVVAALLFGLHALRLRDWHCAGIWRKPLLWSLYLAYASLVAGFALRALSVWTGLSPMIALHAFVYGGIGLMTLGMMARVSLGHTGRNVFDPPAAVGPLFGLLFLGLVFRVPAPLLFPEAFVQWILLAQGLWMLAFAGFAWIYLPMLLRPRVDGRPG